MTQTSEKLLAELQKLDDREDQILQFLVEHGAALEEAERRQNMVSVADLRPLRDGLSALEQTIDKLQADVCRAEASATPPAPPAPPAETTADPAAATNGHDAAATNGHDAPATNGHDAPATNGHDTPAAPPLTTMTFDELAKRIREQDTQAAQIKEILRDRLLALDATTYGPDAGITVPDVDGSGTLHPIPPRTFKLGERLMKGNDVKAFQRQLNFRFKAWGINIRIREHGVYDKQTRHAARRVLRGLGVDLDDAKGGITPPLQRLIEKPRLRTPEQLRRAKRNRRWLHNLKASVADKPPGTSKPQDTSKPIKLPTAHAGSLQAAIREHGGRYEDIIIREAKDHHLQVSLVCAIIDIESEFRNVYGHDGVSNPIKSPPGGVKFVTEANYHQYLKHRNAGRGHQGVGPMQLTFGPFQDRADDLGGCWRVSRNIRAGCEALANEIKRTGSKRQGIRAYNGSGDDAEAYADKILKRQAVWHNRLKGKSAAPPSTKPGPGPSKPAPGEPSKPKRRRTFAVKAPHMHGTDVRGWQKTLRRQFRTWGVDYPLAVDGDYGVITRSATATALYGLGIDPGKMSDGVTPELRIKVRHKRLTARERARFTARAGWRRRLRSKHAGGGVAPPVAKIITSANGFNGDHDGVDLICPAESPLFAMCKSKVVRVSDSWWGLGNPGGAKGDRGDGIIILRSLVSVGPIKKGDLFGYGHAEKPRVKVGQTVKAGRRIGTAGLANAWHTHLMWYRGNPGTAGDGGPKGIGNRDPMPAVNYAIKHGH